ncbi:MAG: dihydrofolate reductase [Oscillospiraceae bacterium]|nr:dihydrofolate reductase [Oscillospiraceae bacterium]
MNCIVNVDENWGIGKNGKLLVNLSADLRRFRQLTEGKTVILGLNTLSTFPGGRPLKNRRNVVLSFEPMEIDGAEVVTSMADALDAVKGDGDACVIGGASVYEQFLPYCDRAQITKTYLGGDADRYFPNLDEMPNWEITWQSELLEENGVKFRYVDYVNHEPREY